MTTEMIVIVGLSIVILILLAFISQANRKLKGYLELKESAKASFDGFIDSQEKLRLAKADVTTHLTSIRNYEETIKTKNETITSLEDKVTELQQRIENNKRPSIPISQEEKTESEPKKKVQKKSNTKRSL